MKNKENIKDRINLLIRYSLEKTLSENKKLLSEQDPFTGVWTPVGYYESLPQKTPLEKLKERGEKIGCDQPNKLFLPGKNKKGLEGEEAMVEEYPCTYPAPLPCQLLTPGEYSRGGLWGENVGTLYLRPGWKVFFWDDMTAWTDYFSQYWGEDLTPEAEEKAIEYYLKIVPLGTVREFWAYDIDPKSGYVDYRGSLKRASSCGWPENDPNRHEWVFDWYYSVSDPDESGKYTASPYPMMEFTDSRSQWDYFLDEYGFRSQVVLGLLYAITGAFCEGCTSVLLFELAAEGALGVASAERDFRKGDMISGVLDLIFAVLPAMKGSKFFGAVTAEEGFEVLADMRKAGLSRTSKPTDVIRWYRRNASQRIKQNFSRMVKSGDEWSEKRIKEFFKQADNEFISYIRQHPTKLMEIPWYRNIHKKELAGGALLGLVGLVLQATMGQQLNDTEKMRLERVHANIKKVDEELCQEFDRNLLNNASRAKDIANAPATKEMADMDPSIAGDPKLWQNKSKEAFGDNYENIPEDNTGELLNTQLDKKVLKDKLKKENWYTKEQAMKLPGWPREIYDIQIFNGVKYYKMKETTTTPEVKPETQQPQQN